eukprot:scaffold11_cov257-Pinguiococcus_pyrenoidosus.AAC.56
MERRSRAVPRASHACPAVEQQLDGRRVAEFGRHQKRSRAVLAAGVDACPVSQEKLHNVELAHSRGQVQGSLSQSIPRVHVCLVLWL